ncbi:MAG: alpha/beta hydrolase family protein [Acidimicrobiales bacterium]
MSDQQSGADTNRPYTTVTYGEDPSQFVEIWDPTIAGNKGTAILIHGGYWRDFYGLDLMHSMAEHLTGRGWTVANVEYRRLAEPVGSADGDVVPDPDMWAKMSSDIKDAIACATDPGLVEDLDQTEPSPVVTIGHSAGGHLALWAAKHARADGVVALAPVADLVSADRLSLSNGVVRRLLNGDSESRPERYRTASPLAAIPLGVPQLIVHGAADENVPQEMALDYGAKAAAAGDRITVEAPKDVDHFHVIDPGHKVWRTIDGWIDELRARY